MADGKGFDIDTLTLITRLTLTDIEEITNARKGKSRADAALSDEEMALHIQQETFQTLSGVLEDERFAVSYVAALRSDRERFDAPPRHEKGKLVDHTIPLADNPAMMDSQHSSKDDLHPFTKYDPYLFSLLNDDRGDADTAEASSSTSHDPVLVSEAKAETRRFCPRQLLGRGKRIFCGTDRVDCVVCADSVKASSVFRAPCGHNYCRNCLVSLIEASTRDEYLYPLRCCKQNFPVAEITCYMEPDLLSLFRKKAIEFGTPSGCRIYCPIPTCSAFIGPTSSSEIFCPQCQTAVCSNCRNAVHSDESCAVNDAIVKLRTLALSEAWQTCPGCHNIIELTQGCYHMTCRCGAQFCYICATPWKNCSCPQWDEHRLARRRLLEELGGQPEEQVRQRIAQFRLNRGCFNHQWRHNGGGGHCDECCHYSPQLLMHCRNCQSRACVRCMTRMGFGDVVRNARL